MVGEIVFHLGDCKTGTTSIQKTLASGTVASPHRTLLYSSQTNHIPLASSLHVNREAKYADERFSGLAYNLKKSRADTAVISAEAFEFVDPRALEKMIDRHLSPWKGRMRFISYVRPHADRMVSAFAERTKQGAHIGDMDTLFDRLLEKRLLYFAPRFQSWRDTFGEAYTLRPMVRSTLREGDVVTDFLDFVFEGQDFSFEPLPLANEALTLSDLAALRKIHAVLRDETKSNPSVRQARNAFGWNMAFLLSALPRPENADKPKLHADLARRVVDTYCEDAATVDRDFFGCDPDTGPLSQALAAALTRATDIPQPIVPEAYFDAASLRMLQSTAEMFARMIQHDPETMIKGMRPQELQGAGGKKRGGGKKGKGPRSKAIGKPASPMSQLARRLPEGVRRKLRPLRRRLS